MRLNLPSGASTALIALVACGTWTAACQPEPATPTSAQTMAAATPPPPPPPIETSRPSNEAIRAELEAAHGGAPKTDPAADGGTASAASADSDASAPAPDGDAARRDFETKSRERLARIDARARELEQKAGKLTGTKRTTFDSGFRRFAADRDDASGKLDALGRNGDWKSGKGGVERSLDALESALTRLDDNL